MDAEIEWSPFRFFTRDSLFNIELRIRDEQAIKEAEKKANSSLSEDDEIDEPTYEPERKPNPKLEAGRKLPPSLEDVPSEYIARPLEDLDEHYHNKKVRLIK